MSAAASSTITIRLRDFEGIAHLGVHAWEKHPERPTRVFVNVALEVPLADYYGKAGGYIDYDPIYAHLQSWADRPHSEHIETLAEGLVTFLFEATPAARAIVSIEKPDIFHDVERIGISYDVSREDWAALKR
jgi:dihydroneopterin aldolase